jgi:Uncharacterized protein conserved in bacteria
MVRLLAFALHAHERLAFGQGIGSDDEPDLWQRDLTGAIEAWIDVGLPDDKRIRKACGRAAQVFVYGYGGHGADTWWNQIGATLERSGNLTVMKLPVATSRALARLAPPQHAAVLHHPGRADLAGRRDRLRRGGVGDGEIPVPLPP